MTLFSADRKIRLTSPKIHFHSLDVLRFLAFFKVFLLHIPLQGDFPVFAYLKSGGGIGVAFFFVLSGVLISYLLVHEKLENKQINPKHFLLRRILRIWPLYFLMLLFAYLLPFSFRENIGMHMVSGGYTPDWRYSFSFLENYQMLFTDNFPKTSPLSVFWSICIEEHFYLFWLVALYFLPIRYLPGFLGACFGLAWLARGLEPTIFNNSTITTNDLFTNLDFFAAGGWVGYLAASRLDSLEKRVLAIPIILRKGFVLLVLCMVIFQEQLLPYRPEHFLHIFRPTVLAVFFALLIAVFLPRQSTIRLDNRVLNYLGKISYGLYVYHILFVHCFFQYCLQKEIRLDDGLTLALYVLAVLAASITMSAISYHAFELPFMRLRQRLKG